MPIIKKEELMEKIRNRIGDDTGDEALSLIEDVNDTFTDLENRAGEDWKARYEENDRAWREKYRDRFFKGSDDDMKDEPEEEKEQEDIKTSFEELFE